MKNTKPILLRCLLFFVIGLSHVSGFTQEEGVKTDSLYAARLMQDNLELYSQVDSLNGLIKKINLENNKNEHSVDSMKLMVAQLQSDLLMSSNRNDTLEAHRLHLKQELLGLKQQMLTLSTGLEQKLQLLRDQEFQLNECRIKVREAESVASLSQARLEGRNEVNLTKVEARDREIAYMQETVQDKDHIISEKTAELSAYFHEKSSSLRLVDSLSRTLNARELEFVKVNERLRIIEAQYNEMLAQRTAATNKKKKVRFVQGVALKNFRTPDFQLAPQSSGSTAVYVITNKNAGKLEFDYITGVSLSLYDLSKPDGKYTYDAGMFVGFGGTNLFKNFYIAPSCKAFDYFHFMVGLNIAEYQQLQSGFKEGDALPPGMSIPTVKEWKANLFFGMTIDFELLTSIPKKM